MSLKGSRRAAWPPLEGLAGIWGGARVCVHTGAWPTHPGWNYWGCERGIDLGAVDCEVDVSMVQKAPRIGWTPGTSITPNWRQVATMPPEHVRQSSILMESPPPMVNRGERNRWMWCMRELLVSSSIPTSQVQRKAPANARTCCSISAIFPISSTPAFGRPALDETVGAASVGVLCGGRRHRGRIFYGAVEPVR